MRFAIWMFLLGLASFSLASAANAQSELRWNLQPGQAFSVTAQQQTISNVAYSGKQATTEIDLTMELSWTVTAADDQSLTFKQALRRVVFKLDSSKAGKVEFDSAAKSRPSGQAREIAAAANPLVGAELEITISRRGEVQSVKPVNEAAEKLIGGTAGGEEAAILSPSTLQQLLRQPLMVLPEKPVASGDRWTTSTDFAGAIGTGLQETTYRFASSVDQAGVKLEKIESTSKLDLTKPAGGKTPLAIKEHEQSGTILFSSADGRVVSAEQTQKLVTERTYRETTIVVTLSSKQATHISPAPPSP